MSFIITQISQAATNPERANLFLNGKFWLGLNKNNLLSLKLTKGQELSNLEKHEIEKAAHDNKLVEQAIRFAQIRPRSCGEVRDYLVYKRSISKEEAEDVLAYLQEKNLLSDEKFAQWYVDYKLSSGVNGINKIKIGLLQKKVDKSVIAKVLEKVAATDDYKTDQSEKLEEYAQKVVKTIKAKNPYELKSKLIQKLMARGFLYEEIKKTVKNMEVLN